MTGVFESLPTRAEMEGPSMLQRARRLHQQGQLAAASQLYSAILADNPDDFDALHLLGVIKHQQGQPEEAAKLITSALKQNPRSGPAWLNLSAALRAQRRYAEALTGCDKALELTPESAEGHYNRGNILQSLRRFEEALASYDGAIALKPDYLEAHNNRGVTLSELKRSAEALQSFDRALALKPSDRNAFSGAADAALRICDWRRTQEIKRRLETGGVELITPFILLGYSESSAAQLKCARHYIAGLMPELPKPLRHERVRHRGEKIKIAYFSAGFHRHPTAYLAAELFELHDRARFEVFGISSGRDDRSEIRARLVAAFDQFHDVRSRSDREVAELLHDLGVDIVVDLNGFLEGARPGVLAHRPAAIQVNYLGYPGTLGADFIDYVIADRHVLPFSEQANFAEKIVHLPNSYQANDSTREISALAPTRREAGLPDDGFVFCCFNNSYKITARVFDVWARLLHARPGSVLWLLRDNADAENNLRKEAQARNIDPTRLIFANRANLDEHLARHRLADLFLDTLPINAHTTGSDALRAGVPVLTCAGTSFAGRVGASLLPAAGLPELVTERLEQYEELAIRLSADSDLLAALKQKLARARKSCALFDSTRFARDIEAAYATMWEISQRGESPRAFTVGAT